MNSDRIIKILERRPQISVSSDDTYDPDDRKDLEKCMLDMFRQFGEFKKKKYNLTLGTSLDTQELEDMDMAILLCMAETAFGVGRIPADDLKKMQTFYDVADYVEKNLPEKSECSGCKKEKVTNKTSTAQQPIVSQGCVATISAMLLFLLCGFAISNLMIKLGIPYFWSTAIAFIVSSIASLMTYSIVNNKKNEDKTKARFSTTIGIGCSGWMIVIMVWGAAVMTANLGASSLGVSEDACALAILIGGAIAAIVTYKLLKRRIATNNEDIPDGAQKESDENSNNKASKTFIDIVLVAVAWLIAYLVVYSIANYALGANEEVSASLGSCAGAIGAIWMYMFRHRRKSDDANDIL